MASNDVLVRLVADVSSLQNGMKKAQQELNTLKSKTEKSTSGISKSFGTVGKAVAGAFTVASVVSFGKTVVNTSATFQDSMSKVQALSGATGKELDQLREMAKKMGSETAHSASASADAMGYMALAGWDTQQIMAGLPSVLSLASAGQMDLARASDIVTDTMSMFSMKAEESGRASDVFAKVQAKSNTSVEQLGESMKYAGATASAFGLDIEETSALLGVMANNGIKGSMSGTALKSILSRLSAPTAEVNKGFATLGVSLKDTNGNMKPLSELLPEIQGKMAGLSEEQQIQVAKNIAGAEAMSGFLAIVNGASTDLPTLTNELKNAGGFAEETAATMEDNLGGSIREMKSAFEGMVITIGEKVTPYLIPVIESLGEAFKKIPDIISRVGEIASPIFEVIGDVIGGCVDVVKNIVEWFREHETVALILASTIGILTAGIIAFNIWLKAGAIATGIWTTVSSIATGVTTAFAVAMAFLTSPIGLVTLAIAGVVAVGILLWKNWGSVSAFLISCWNGLLSAISWVWEGIKTVISTVINVIWTIIKTYINLIVTFWTTAFKVLWTIVSTVFKIIAGIIATVLTVIWTIITTVWNAIYKFIKPILELIRTVITAVWQGIQLVIAVILTIITGIIKVAWEGIKLIIQGVLFVIQTIIQVAWTVISTIISVVLNIIITIVSTAWEVIKGIIQVVLGIIKTIIQGAWNIIKGIIQTVLNIIKNIISTVWNGIKTIISTVLNIIKGIVSTVWNGISGTISNVVNGIKSVVVIGFNFVKDKVSGIFNGLKSVVMGIWNGIGKGIQGVVNGIISVINGMVRAMNKISFDVPDWVPLMGGKKFGFNLPEVSKVSWFANGGIIEGTEGGTIVGVGEAGDEAILPLSNKSKMLPFARAVADMMPDKTTDAVESTSSGVAINIENLSVREEADIKKIAEELFKIQERNKRRKGFVYA